MHARTCFCQGQDGIIGQEVIKLNTIQIIISPRFLLHKLNCNCPIIATDQDVITYVLFFLNRFEPRSRIWSAITKHRDLNLRFDLQNIEVP